MVEESKDASQTQNKLRSQRMKISEIAQSLSTEVGKYSAQMIQADMDQKVINASELLHELLSQAEMVTSVVDDMRRKIQESLISAGNVDGCCFGEVDDYLKSFEDATQQLKDQFSVNQELLEKSKQGASASSEPVFKEIEVWNDGLQSKIETWLSQPLA